jgi:hypothetical protein
MKIGILGTGMGTRSERNSSEEGMKLQWAQASANNEAAQKWASSLGERFPGRDCVRRPTRSWGLAKMKSRRINNENLITLYLAEFERRVQSKLKERRSSRFLRCRESSEFF